MPVSTRSQISVSRDEPAPADRRVPAHLQQEGLPSPKQQQQRRPQLLRDPHHGLKEKMRALTLLYEQHQQKQQRKESAAAAAAADHNRPDIRVLATHHPSVELADSKSKKNQENVVVESDEMKENIVLPIPLKAPAAEKNHNVFPRVDAKENQEAKYQNQFITVYSCPPKNEIAAPVTEVTTVARKLSLGNLAAGGVMSEVRFETVKAADNGDHYGGGGSRIHVFVRLRPMAKKEKEAGARSCVKIVNRKDVYLTEFASETDYLRLKRVRGRHFCFDSSFSDTTTQQEVYATT